MGRCWLVVAVVSMALAACGQGGPSESGTSNELPAASPSLSLATCGVGYSDQNAKIWVAASVYGSIPDPCSAVTDFIRKQGEQPVNWSGQLSDTGPYSATCSDDVRARSWEVQYEVVDTGEHLIGSELCQFMVQQYGSSGTVTKPDLFSIIANGSPGPAATS